MNVSDYFKSISLELNALKNRVRYFISDNHWQTDGEWKESVLRAVLRRHLPNGIEVGRGFVITPERCSAQIDVLIYDSSVPTLYKDGDLVFVTNDAVKAIIEVKSKIYKNTLLEVFTKLADQAEFVNRSRPFPEKGNLYVGLFAFESEFDYDYLSRVLDHLHAAAEQNNNRIINHTCFGESLFVKYWENFPDLLPQSNYNKWHGYNFPQVAPGYFINNLINAVAGNSVNINKFVWFPREGKELFVVAEKRLNDTPQTTNRFLQQQLNDFQEIERYVDEASSND